MNRYKKANEGIHAPDELKKEVVERKPRTTIKWVSAVAAVLVAAIAVGLLLPPGDSPTPPIFSSTAHAATIAEAEYPPMSDYPNELSPTFRRDYDAWWKDLRARRDMAPDRDVLAEFYAAVLPEFLGNSDGENLVCSPLNIYMALAMLAETSDGNSRQQILDLLGVNNIGSLRKQTFSLWNSIYRDDGAVTSILASSLWLNEDIPFVQQTMDRLADTYYASSYQGTMGSPEFNGALQNWLNEQTGGLLEDAAKSVELDPNTVLALATTLYYRAKWADEFNRNNNIEDTFHGTAGPVTTEFMRQSDQATYYWGDQFSAYSEGLEESGSMLFILPDEGVSVDDLLTDPQVMSFLLSRYDWENSKYLIVNFSMPKFDVSSQVDLTDGLKSLGVTDVFDAGKSDFTPMTTAMEGISVGKATHAARVRVDEEGVEATAFTVMLYAGSAAPPEDEVDFVLDRPFLFAITGEMGQLLFVGVVNQV